MRTLSKAGLLGSFLIGLAFVGPASLSAQEAGNESAPAAPEMPKPQKEHQWLQQLVGEWDVTGEANFGPDQPPIKCQGAEKVRSLGGFWTIAEGENHTMGMQVRSVMTLGYDSQKKKYVGTWVDSVQNHMWKYEGTLDETGKILTLETVGPNPLVPGETANYRDVIEIKGKDHKVLRSSMQTEDGEWMTFMTADYRRKK